MYVWTVEFEEMWNDDGEWMEGAEWTVAAKTYDEALKKAEKLALSKSRGFKDDDTREMHYVTKVRLVNIKRGTALDA